MTDDEVCIDRLQAIRDLLGDLHAQGEVSVEVHNKIIRLTHGEQP